MTTIYNAQPTDRTSHKKSPPDEGEQAERLAQPRVSSLHRWLWALLLLTAIKGWLWAAIFPPLQASDEIHHIGYARDIARCGSLVVEPRDFFTSEEIVALEIAQIVEVSGYRRPLDLSPQRVQEIEQLKSLLRNPAEQPPSAPSSWVQFFSRNHPPLYYALGALLEVVARPPDLLEHLALGRLLSVLFSVGTVGLMYLLTQEVLPAWPHLWLAAAIVVSFAPMTTYLGSVYTNQALEITLFTAIFWMMTRVIRLGLNWPRSLWLGLLLGAGLLTKASFAIAVPLIAIVAFCDLLGAKGRQRAWILVFLLPTILAAPWYLHILGLTIRGLPIRSEEAVGCAPFFSFLRSLPICRILLRVWNESVASFGHRDTLFPQPLYLMVLVSLALAIVGWGQQVYWASARRREGRSHQLTAQQWLTAGILLLACLEVFGFHFLRAYVLSCNKLLELQGRQVVVIAAGPMLLLLMGWLNLSLRHWRWLIALVILLCVALNNYSLVDRLIWRYYGSQQDLAVDSRDLLSTPLTAGYGLVQCLTVAEMQLNRVDIWLQKECGVLAGELQLRLTDGEGRTVMEARSKNLGWVPTYPAYFQFAPLDVGGMLCLRLQGELEGVVQAWATESSSIGHWFNGDECREGSLALRLYRPVPWRTIPDRMAVQSADLYTSDFYWGLGSVYALGLVGFLVLYLRWLLRPCQLDMSIAE